MQEMGQAHRGQKRNTDASESDVQTHVSNNGSQYEDEHISDDDALEAAFAAAMAATSPAKSEANASNFKWQFVRQELHEIRELLSTTSHAMQV
jgi:hypothetical protein